MQKVACCSDAFKDTCCRDRSLPRCRWWEPLTAVVLPVRPRTGIRHAAASLDVDTIKALSRSRAERHTAGREAHAPPASATMLLDPVSSVSRPGRVV